VAKWKREAINGEQESLFRPPPAQANVKKHLKRKEIKTKSMIYYYRY
jgi:hypothetical protein